MDDDFIFSLDRMLICDLETGGFVPGTHPILEIAIRCEWGPSDPSPLDFSVVVKPTEEEWLACNENALLVNQFTWEELQEKGVPLDEAAQRLSSWLLKCSINASTVTWVGQNPDFDLRFLEHYMGNYLEFVGLFPVAKQINVIDLARKLKKLDKTFSPISLGGGSISSALGLTPEDHVHRAMGGVMAARQNYYQLQRRLAEFEPQPTTPYRKKVKE